MIASVPSAPVLLPGITGRPVAEVEELRAACLRAIELLVQDHPAEVVLVGAAEPVWDQGRPLTELIGRTLLAEADSSVPIRYISSAGGLELGRTLAGSSLLVVADGSARRGLKAPGYLDERAAPFDQQLLAALASGKPDQLAAIDGALAADLLVAGWAAWQVMAGAAEGRTWSSETLYANDPFGVFYPVLTWR